MQQSLSIYTLFAVLACQQKEAVLNNMSHFRVICPRAALDTSSIISRYHVTTRVCLYGNVARALEHNTQVRVRTRDACVKSNFFLNGGQRTCSNMKVYLQTSNVSIAVTKYCSGRKCASFLARRIFANWRI